MMKLINGVADEISTTVDAIQEKMVEMNTQIGVTMKAVENVTAV